MRKLFLMTIAAFLLSGGLSFAADAAQDASSTAPAAKTAAAVPAAKIGVVDMQTIAIECEPAKAFKEEMEKKYGKERAELEKQGNAIKKQVESLKNPKVSDEKKNAFIKARRKLEDQTRTFMRKVEQDEVKFRQDMVSLVFSATYEVARAKGFNFVVDVTAGGVLYADQSMDLTQDVLAEINKMSKKDKASEKEAAKPAAKEETKK